MVSEKKKKKHHWTFPPCTCWYQNRKITHTTLHATNSELFTIKTEFKA